MHANPIIVKLLKDDVVILCRHTPLENLVLKRPWRLNYKFPPQKKQVVTTIGPRKPQRQYSSVVSESSITSIPKDQVLHLHHSPTQNLQQMTPNSKRVQMETSFGSPTAANGTRHNQNGLHAKNPVPIRKASSSTKSLKTVVFSTNGISYPPPPKFKPTTLSLCETRPNPFDGKIVDLIYDDWFGLAPLASPESLSELSSISSRASISLNLNLSNSIEKFLNNVVINCKTPSPPAKTADQIYESQLHTPIVIRRTPKFSENLAMCADDWKTQNNYKRMGKVFITNPKLTGSDSDSNGDGSYGTAESLPKAGCCNNNDNILKDNRMQQDWKSADNIDNKFDAQQNNHKFTVSDSAMMNECRSQCPVCPCTKLPPEECCQKYDHISCIMISAQEQRNSGKYSITNTTSSSDTYYSLTGSECGFIQNGTRILLSKLGTYEEETLTCELPASAHNSITLNPTTISSITRSGILESHFPVYFDSSDEKSSLLSHENSPSQRNPQRKAVHHMQSHVTSKKSGDEFSGFSRNESLPLLSSLVEKSSPTNYMKRKKVIYPIHTPPILQPSPRIIPTTRSKSTPTSITNLYVFNESNV